jgi:hypothetical protein
MARPGGCGQIERLGVDECIGDYALIEKVK